MLYADGQGVEQSDALAVVLLERACEGGDAQGCNNLGVMAGAGRGTASSGARARTLYARACALGFAPGCDNQKKNEDIDARAREACQEGSPAACVHLGQLAIQQDNTAAAAPLFEQACVLDSASACFVTGMMYGEGVGVSADAARSRELLTRSCDGGHTPACKALSP